MNSTHASATSRTEAAAARIAARANHPWYVRLIFAAQRRKYGSELEPARLWGRLPRSFLFLTLLYRSIDRAGSPIEPALRALVQVRVSQVNGCGFCVDLNGAAALARAGEPDPRVLVAAMAREVGATPLARLDYAAVVDDRTFEPVDRLGPDLPARALIAAGFSSARLIDNLRLPDVP